MLRPHERRTARRTRLLQWEYWPSKAFYYPMVPYLLYLMLRARHVCFCTATNPGIYSGGIGLESKYETLLKLPRRLRPKSILVCAGETGGRVRTAIHRAELQYPLVAKPNLGFRGLLVHKVKNEAELLAYLRRYPVDFLVQEYIDLPEEVGLLYHRMPGEKTGTITSLTTKEFLSVIGNGQATVRELIGQHPRALLQLERLLNQHGLDLERVPSAGERVPLGIVGNHAKGTRFINSNDLITPAMVRQFDQIADGIAGFHYGRFDLKCADLSALETGEGLRIIELNGACSEPTHIYDPQRGTYPGAVKAIAQHWKIIYRIAKINHRAGHCYTGHREIAQAFRDLFAYQAQIREWSQLSDN